MTTVTPGKTSLENSPRPQTFCEFIILVRIACMLMFRFVHSIFGHVPNFWNSDVCQVSYLALASASAPSVPELQGPMNVAALPPGQPFQREKYGLSTMSQVSFIGQMCLLIG